MASLYGYTDVIVTLLQYDADVDRQDSCGRTPLHYAASPNHSAVVRLLLHYGADFNRKNTHGKTALEEASTWGQSDTIRELIAHGAAHGGWKYKMQAAIYRIQSFIPGRRR
eukprot:TRINITY_DN6891_c0_g1_i1.p1 TRINITY_DN6891_c0_g1~~TRINITY_DN6891_c0_g1_i1.p1  ORF type:complete len:111 (+),score=12.20 TRINITY_DN6891_c0_g1_i1:224-556(+)